MTRDTWPYDDTRLVLQIIGEKDADGFYWGEAGTRSGFVPCNMVSEVQVNIEDNNVFTF